MTQIAIRNLSFTYPGSYDPVFEHVSFQLDSDWKLGFTGRNGRGKTTFLRLLMGEYPYEGQILSPLRFDYFPFSVACPAQTTEQIVAELRPEASRWQLLRELSLLGLPEDLLARPFQTLSHGEQTKVLLATLFLAEGHFLLIDEPTNHLDQAGRTLVSDYLCRKRGFILVSHDRSFLDRCIDHILVINRNNIEIQQGNFSTWQQNKQYQDQHEQAENEKLRRDIQRLGQAAKRNSRWAEAVEKSKFGAKNGEGKTDKGYVGHKAAKMMQRAKNNEKRREKALQEKQKLLQNLDHAGAILLKPQRHHSKRLVELQDIAIAYAGREILSHFNLEIENGERIALCGKNGCGKSSLLKLILGELAPSQGSVRLASGLRLSYVPQNSAFLRGSLREYAQKQGLEEALFKAILRQLDFSRLQFEKDMADFSAGQKKKVLLAQSLCQEAHLYIWDEPLNYIDVLSRMQIEELILAHRPTLLFVEHDAAFVQNTATRSIWL